MIITRRYVSRGPSLEELQARLDPAIVIVAANYFEAVDVTFDDAVSPAATVDSVMALCGFVVPSQNTSLAATPFLGIKSPDGSIWRFNVDNAGVVATTKVYDPLSP
jgi:hypothetical protein